MSERLTEVDRHMDKGGLALVAMVRYRKGWCVTYLSGERPAVEMRN